MKRRAAYHHGNLREALLDAAVSLIAEVGLKAFTLREVARRAGVSHNAPYRHFQDKEELLAAVRTQGFRELTEAMLNASGPRTIALKRLKKAGLAYVVFALRRPEHFMAMFDGSSFMREQPDSAAARQESFDTLLDLVKSCQRENHLPTGDPLRLALLLWSMVHGVAKLATTGCLPYKSEGDILKFTEFVIDESLPVGPARMR